MTLIVTGSAPQVPRNHRDEVIESQQASFFAPPYDRQRQPSSELSPAIFRLSLVSPKQDPKRGDPRKLKKELSTIFEQASEKTGKTIALFRWTQLVLW